MIVSFNPRQINAIQADTQYIYSTAIGGAPAANSISARLITIQGYHTVPGINSGNNAVMRDVIGNKTDTVAGNSLISLIKQLIAVLPTTVRDNFNEAHGTVTNHTGAYTLVDQSAAGPGYLFYWHVTHNVHDGDTLALDLEIDGQTGKHIVNTVGALNIDMEFGCWIRFETGFKVTCNVPSGYDKTLSYQVNWVLD